MSHSLKKLGIELSDLEQKSKMSSFRINLDKIFATLSVTMFTFSIYFWYLFMTDFMAEAAADEIKTTKSTDVYVSSEKIGKLMEYDAEISSVFKRVLPHSTLLSDVLTLIDPFGDVTEPLFKTPTSDPAAVYHPMNQYLILYKFCKLWPLLEQLVSPWYDFAEPTHLWNLFGSEREELQDLLNSAFENIRKNSVPEIELRMAAGSMLRLQEVYNLSTGEITSGFIRGYPSLRSLRQAEVDFMLKSAVNSNDTCRAWKWLNQSVVVRSGKLFFMVVEHPKNEKTCQYLCCAKGEGCVAMTRRCRNFSRLCRETHGNWQLTKYTRCSYFVPHSTFVYQPLKVQWFLRSPKVFQIIDFLNRDEIDTLSINFLASNRGAIVNEAAVTQTMRTEIRTGTTGWLHDVGNPEVSLISRKIGLATGRNISNSEGYQIGNYGIGGHYHHHQDYFTMEYMESSEFNLTGNRLLTVMIYLSDVVEGGFTAFTDLDLAVRPQLGSALVWYNLFANGTGDERTRHGGCPVLIGNKKIANKWIHHFWQNLKCSPHSNLKKTGLTVEA